MSKRPLNIISSEEAATHKKSKHSKGHSSKEKLGRFINDKSSERYMHFCSPTWRQKIVPCYFIDLEKVDQLGLKRTMEIFGELSVFLTCNEQICDQAVWEFYANLERRGAEIFSRVKSKNICITQQTIRQAFGISYDDNSLNPYYANTWPEQDWCDNNEYDLVELSQRYFKVQWHKTISTKREYKPKNLNASARVVYELMWLMLANSGGHSSEPTIGQVLLFFALMEGKRIDYARYLMTYFTYAVLGDRDLPCGNLIMRVLKFAKVSYPANSSFIECKEITQDFFKNKKVEYKASAETWITIVPKNPTPKPNEGESSSHRGNEDLEAMMERVVEKAQAPLLAKIEGLERILDKFVTLQSTLIDEVDVIRQSHLMGMDDAKFNKIVAYRKELEMLRVARMGESAKCLRSEKIRATRQEDEGEGSSERSQSQSEDQSPLI